LRRARAWGDEQVRGVTAHFSQLTYNPRPSMTDAKFHLAGLVRNALERAFPDTTCAEIVIERPRDPAHGDFACTVALQLAKQLKRPPRQIAEAIRQALIDEDAAATTRILEAVEIAGAGFINFRLAPEARVAGVRSVLRLGRAYGRAEPRGEKVVIEFVSANPTGPLHVGHGRQAALGDTLSALLEARGQSVTREFYYNDAGVQIQTLALSVQARLRGLKPGDADWPDAAYNGDYVQDIASDYLARSTVTAADGTPVSASGDTQNLEDVRRFAVAYLRHEQDVDLRAFGTAFDVFSLESGLYAEGRVAAVVGSMIAAGRTYEKDGALWLRTTAYGDDKDRVVRKSDGSFTYFVPDVAYHIGKWERGFRHAINVQGTDHHSTITRVRAGLQAVAESTGADIPTGYPDYVLHSMVKVMRGGEEVKISKRAGSYVTLRDLVEWVGRDAVRFFLVSRRADSEFLFDIDLALSKSEENPVYYVQYAHARICSLLSQWAGLRRQTGIDALLETDLSPLALARETALAQRLAAYPEVLDDAARELAPHTLTFFLRDLASEFHSYYNAERILVDDSGLCDARVALCAAVRQVLANGLSLLGVSAPEKM
jgi:arginyl-tRNA synthetase